jgi:EH_Signature domain
MHAPELTGSPLAALRASLELAMEFKLPQFDDEFAALERETKKLHGWLGGHGVAKPPQDASRAALRDFVRERDLPTLKRATLACFGCADPFDDRRHGLIADGELFPVFLDKVDDYRESPRALRLCYRGLLHAYFQYDVERAPPAARDNWGRLRTYLGDRTSFIVTPGFQPPWVATLNENPEVLGLDPGAFYGSEIFRGRPEKFEQVRTELPITDASWLVWRVIVGQIEAATGFPDAEFRAAIPGLLDLLERHPTAKTFGLSKLLSRYRQCASAVLHERLRDFVVDAWGNPWLALNEAAWSVVSPDARMMVAEWLKLALMQKFFGLLAEDGLNDTRRLKFWETYHQSIHAMYFALGEMARTDRRADFREVRKQMDGLQLTLTHSTAKNNAFIMCIGEHVIVEFGEKGNACFIFRRNEIPFALAGEVAGNSLALKGTRGRLERLTHMDGSERWEDKFRRVLANVVRVRPPSGKHGPTSTGSRLRPTVPSQAAPSFGAPQTPAAQDSHSDRWQLKPQHALPVPPTTKFTMTEFATFCESHQLSIADNREKGGNLWVDHTYPSTDVAAQLSAWGFHFKPTAGWWFK